MPRSSVTKKREGFENEDRHSGYTIPALRQGDDGGGDMRGKAKHLSYFFYKDTAWDSYTAHEINVMFVRSSLICFPPDPPRKESCDSSGPCKSKKE